MAKTEKQVIAGGYHRPVCVECKRELHPEENGVGVLDMANGIAYELYDADLWKCPGCGMEVIGGFGMGPVASHFEDNFKKVKAGYRTLIVNNG